MKALVINDGTHIGRHAVEYRPSRNPGGHEQIRHLVDTTITARSVLAEAGVKGADIAGIGLSGQMHSSVFLDEHDEVIRPALLWCDGRTT